jgi:hypothetical protein
MLAKGKDGICKVERSQRERTSGERTYLWLSGRAGGGNAFTGHAQRQGGQDDIEKLHDDFLRCV